MKTISVTVIVKNEETTLPRLLDTVTFADEIVIADSGSADNTVQVARRYTDKVYSFGWVDDFSAARNFAIEHATCQYVMWLDADDVVPKRSAEAIAAWKHSPSDAVTCMAKYCTSFDDDGKVNFWFWRERILKNCPQCRFDGAVHEAIVPFGMIEYLDDVEIWHKQVAPHVERNLNIYRKQLAQGKVFSARETYYYGRTLLENGLTAQGEEVLQGFVDGADGYFVDKIQALTTLGKMKISADPEEAKRLLCRSFGLYFPQSEACCALADCFFAQENYRIAAYWYKQATLCKNDVGFVSSDYSALIPYLQLCVCHWRLGEREIAEMYNELALSVSHKNPSALRNREFFQGLDEKRR